MQQASNHTNDQPEPATGDGASAALFATATLGLYRANAFRVLALPTTASLREAARALERRRMLAKLGQQSSNSDSMLDIVPGPTLDELRTAEKVIHEPDLRLVHELFWFMPLALHGNDIDAALDAIGKRDLRAAYAVWHGVTKNKETAPIEAGLATHNLAVSWLLRSLDQENARSATEDQVDDRKVVETSWSQAFGHWATVARDPPTWNALSARVMSLNDERLSLEFVQSLRRLLPRAITKIACEAILQLAENGHGAEAARLLRLLRDSPLHEADTSALIDQLWLPLKLRIRQAISKAETNGLAGDSKSTAAAQSLLNALQYYRPLLPTLRAEGAHQDIDSVEDEIAESVMAIAIGYYNATEESDSALDLLRRAVPFAHSGMLTAKLRTNIATLEGNAAYATLSPIFIALKAIDESKASAVERLVLFRSTIPPLLATFHELIAGSVPVKTQLFDRIARSLHSISVDAWNSSSDGTTALDALGEAQAYAMSPATTKELAEGRTLLTRLYSEKRRERDAAKRRSRGNAVLWIVGILFVVWLFANSNSKPTGNVAAQQGSANTIPPSSGNDTKTYRIPPSNKTEVEGERIRVGVAKQGAARLSQELSAARAVLDMRQQQVSKEIDQVNRLGNTIDVGRGLVRDDDALAVNQFNLQVAQYNRRRAHAQQLAEEADALVGPYNALLQRAQSAQQEADRLVDEYNAMLSKYGRPIN